MRGLALQQVREGTNGGAPTRFFVELLPSLEAEAQSALLEALADRGDALARPAALQALRKPE
jgi:hypothetical protein